MELEEIIEGNKLIAEFMECKKREGVIQGRPLDYLVEGYWTVPDKLKYDLSWDWLIPVVEKIEQLTYRFTISTTFVRVHTCKKSWDDSDEYHTGVFEGKLNTTWVAVVEFIKWHNSQTAVAVTPNEVQK